MDIAQLGLQSVTDFSFLTDVTWARSVVIKPCVVLAECARELYQSGVMAGHIGCLLNVCENRAKAVAEKVS